MKNKKEKTKKNQSKVSSGRNKSVDELYKMGKIRYVWSHGVLSWGISTGIIFMLLTGIIQYGFAPGLILSHTFGPSGIVTILLFALVGFLWGSIMWIWVCKKVEKEGNKKIEKEHNKKKK